ncbi:hypothetical protein [Streptomyces sp. NPDC055749]
MRRHALLLPRCISGPDQRLVEIALRREDEDEVLSDSEGHLPQAGQDDGLGGKTEAKGCGGMVSSGQEVWNVLQVLVRQLAAFLGRERLTASPPRGDQQQPQELGQADRNQSRTSFGVGIQGRTFLTAFATEELRAPGAVAREALQRSARGKVDFLGMVASVQVEATRPSEKTGSFVLFADGSDQRFHVQRLRAHWLTRIIGNQSQRCCASCSGSFIQ